MKVTPEVSDLDFSTAVQFQGFVVPGLITRRASTMVELADGQSFAIAGLLSESVRDSVAKYPVLGDIPILGILFRSSSFRKNENRISHYSHPASGEAARYEKTVAAYGLLHRANRY